MNELYEWGLKDIAMTIIEDSLNKALHETATANWFPAQWDRNHKKYYGDISIDFENMLWLLSDEAYPWFVVAELNHDLFRWYLQRTSAFKRLVRVIQKAKKIGIAYRKFLDIECGITVDGRCRGGLR